MSRKPRFDPDRALCKIDRKHVREILDEIIPRVAHPTLICAKCARVANHKKLLCKPARLPK